LRRDCLRDAGSLGRTSISNQLIDELSGRDLVLEILDELRKMVSGTIGPEA